MIVWSIDPSVGKGEKEESVADVPARPTGASLSAPDIQVTLSILMIVRTVHRRTGCDSKWLFKKKKKLKISNAA